MSRIESERKLISAEMQWIYTNLPRFDLIADMKNRTLENNSLGCNIGHFKDSNYVELYNKAFEEELYTICLSDYSLISMFYTFDSKGKAVSHNLMYIPCPTNEEENVSLQEAISRYLRVDYDVSGYKKTIHTQVHLHTNIYKSKLRIPVAHIITPKDFLYIILKYVYHSEDVFIDNLLETKNREVVLDVDDENKMKLSIGK